MTQLSVEGLNDFNRVLYDKSEENQLQTKNNIQEMKIRKSETNTENEYYMVESPFRSSDPTFINRNRVIGFEKTGQLIKRMKRELSTQNLDKESDRSSNKINDKLSTQPSCCNNNFKNFHWESNQKHQMNDAIMDEYEKQILTLKAEFDDLKEEKKDIKQTLQKQRKFFMSQMYSKQLILDENQFQIERLKGKIERHINLEFQFQQKIRLLQLQNAECKYQLEGWLESSRQNSDSMDPIDEENQDFCINSINSNHKVRRESNKLFMSLDNGFVKSHQIMDEDPYEIMRLAHERQILRYEKDIKCMKEFYENRIRALRKSYSPNAGKPRASINVMDEYIILDTISCESQNRPQNLKSIIRQQFNQQKSAKNVNDSESFISVRYFMYPENSKKNLNGQDLFIREPDNQENEVNSSFEIKRQEEKLSKFQKYFSSNLPSRQFIKGFGFGSVACGILVLFACRNSLKN